MIKLQQRASAKRMMLAAGTKLVLQLQVLVVVIYLQVTILIQWLFGQGKIIPGEQVMDLFL